MTDNHTVDSEPLSISGLKVFRKLCVKMKARLGGINRINCPVVCANTIDFESLLISTKYLPEHDSETPVQRKGLATV